VKNTVLDSQSNAAERSACAYSFDCEVKQMVQQGYYGNVNS